MSKIGIIGGTFNPIHNGHILLALYCKEQIGLDKIIFIPTYTPPHKISNNLASEADRLNMCRIAVKKYSNFYVSDIEIKRKGKSYTYETLSELKAVYKSDTLYFVVGADMFLTLDKWKNPDIIFKNAFIAAVPRNSSDFAQLSDYYKRVLKPLGAKAVILDKPVLTVSSTFIRRNIDFDKNIEPLIDEDVYEYIKQNDLYKECRE